MQVGDKLPSGELLKVGEDGPEPVDIGERFKGRRVVFFAVPGAFTGTCTEAHMPSFVRTADAFREKGVDEIICVAANDPLALEYWSRQTGATDAGITVLGDPTSAYAKAIEMNFSVPSVGFYDRFQRFAALVEDGEVKILNQGDQPGHCEISAGETLLAQI